jgi:hypothetical protein
MVGTQASQAREDAAKNRCVEYHEDLLSNRGRRIRFVEA